MSFQTSDFRNGLKVETEGAPYSIVYFQFVKPGKGTAFTRTKLKNLLTGAVIERTYRSGEILEEADIEEQPMQFLYEQQGVYTFMNTESFEQVEIQKNVIADDAKFLIENLEIMVLFYKGRPVNLTLPNFIESRVAWTEPAVKGNTSNNLTKNAKLECGAEIQVPIFVKEGELLKVDTRDGGSYVSRL